ncbi:MAG: NFACT RNA binding domain-containing protein [Firmicutes bacterium]|nr:NFACT RNA binding domain-containing protein [Bacillota bacterium]
MSYDGVVTYAMVHELNNNIQYGKIEKIYQPQPEQLIFNIHTKQGRRKLFISASGSHSAAYLVEDTPENPVNPPVFCMVLRKHLSAARITSVEQHENDRIIEISMETIDELGFNLNRKLIIEIMGKHSNILLIDVQSGKIIDSIKHVSLDVNRARQILPGKAYEYPPAQDKEPFTSADEVLIGQLVKGQLQPERSLLAGVQGISPVLAQSAIHYSLDDIDGSVNPYAVHNYLSSLADAVDHEAMAPVVYVDEDGKPADFHITPLSAYEQDSRYKALSFDTISQAAAFYFVNRQSSNTVKQRSNDLLRVVKGHLDKLKLKVQRLNEDLYAAENSEKYRLYGELLTANLHLAKQGMKELTVISYYDQSQVKIPLDPRFSPSKNAQNYYKRYGKSKTAIKEKKLQLEDANGEIEYLESVYDYIERAGSIEELGLLRDELTESGYVRQKKDKHARKKKDKPKPYSYTLSSGLSFLAGPKNKENDWLTLKKASNNDIWFHTKDIPGTHVILFTDGQEISDLDFFEAAAIAAYHSKGASSENVPVDYTKVRYVKKPAGAKPGMVIFTHNRTLYVNPGLPETGKKH